MSFNADVITISNHWTRRGCHLTIRARKIEIPSESCHVKLKGKMGEALPQAASGTSRSIDGQKGKKKATQENQEEI